MGALLVAVEAVRLANIRALRDRFFEPAHRASLPIPIFREGDRAYMPRRTDWFGRWVLSPFIPWLIFHALLAAVPLALVAVILGQFGLHVRDAVHAYVEFFDASPIWLDAGLAWATLSAVGLAVLEIGELGHKALIRLLSLPITFLTFVDRRTPDGTVGIIGAFLLIAGFSFQVAGAVIGAGH